MALVVPGDDGDRHGGSRGYVPHDLDLERYLMTK